jgi:hypothetical protein
LPPVGTSRFYDGDRLISCGDLEGLPHPCVRFVASPPEPFSASEADAFLQAVAAEQLTGTLPPELALVTELTKLVISGDNTDLILSGTLPQQWRLLTNLKELTISDVGVRVCFLLRPSL